MTTLVRRAGLDWTVDCWIGTDLTADHGGHGATNSCQARNEDQSKTEIRDARKNKGHHNCHSRKDRGHVKGLQGSNEGQPGINGSCKKLHIWIDYEDTVGRCTGICWPMDPRTSAKTKLWNWRQVNIQAKNASADKWTQSLCDEFNMGVLICIREQRKIMEGLRQSPDPEFEHSVDNSSQNHDIPTPATSNQHEQRINNTTQ